MKLHTVLFLLLLVSMVSTLDASTRKWDSEIRNRFSVWLMQRIKKDSDSLLGASRAHSALLVRTEDVKDTLNARSSPSDLNIRVRRSKGTINQSWRLGCPIATCSVHTLAHRLSEYNNQQKTNSAPLDKISPLGYGRRRRSLAGRRHQGAPLPQT